MESRNPRHDAAFFAAFLALLAFFSVLASCGKVEASSGSPVDPGLLEKARELHALERTAPVPVARSGAALDITRSSSDAAEADYHAPALTADFELRDSAGRALGTRRMVRGERHLFLTGVAGDQTWWIERNPVSLDRISGFRVRPEKGHILEFDESTLREEGPGGSWSRHCRAGVSREEIGTLCPTGEHVESFHSRFVRMLPCSEETRGGLTELWWSDELELPLRAVRETPEGVRELVLIGLRPEVDPAEIEHPAKRWPELEWMDIADYREELHFEEGGEGDGPGHDRD